MAAKITAIFFLFAFLAVGGCIDQETGSTNAAIVNWVKQTPLVQDYFQDNPEAIVTVQKWDKDELSQNMRLVLEKCGQRLQTGDYHFIHLQGEKEELYAWVSSNPDPKLECFKRISIAQVPSDENKSPPTDSKPLEITAITSKNVYDSNAQITWLTTLPASGKVEYGTEPDQLDQVQSESKDAVAQSVLLGNLQPQTTYYYRIIVQNGSNQMASELKKFTTPSNPALDYSSNGLAITNVTLRRSGSNYASISWDTSIPATSVIFFGTHPDRLNLQKTISTYTTNHHMELTDLNFSSTYYYRVYSSTNTIATPLQQILRRISSTATNPITESLSETKTFSTGTETDIRFNTVTHALGLRGPFTDPYTPQIIDYELETRGGKYVGNLPIRFEIIADQNSICQFTIDHNSTGRITQEVVYRIDPINDANCFGKKIPFGTYRLLIKIDPENILGETDEKNNSFSQEFRVQ